MVLAADTSRDRCFDIKGLLIRGERYLREAGVETPRVSAERILEHVLGLEKHELYLNSLDQVSRDKADLYFSLIEKRATRYPTQYLTKECYFMDFCFYVDEDCLIPRPETEILVEKVLQKYRVSAAKEWRIRILDMGTGSGNIAVSLAVYIPQSDVTAVDISEKALKIASGNANRNGVQQRITFLKSDLFKDVPEGGFDFAIFNAPYVSEEEMGSLPGELDYEPKEALNGGKEGLETIERFINETPRFLNEGGFIFLEIGKGQSSRAKGILEKYFRNIETYKDYNDVERIICAQLKGDN